MTTELFYTALVAYGFAAIVYLVYFTSEKARAQQAARILFIGAALFHGAALVVRFVVSGYTPITTTHEAVSFFAWTTALAFLSIRWFKKVKNLGVFASSLVLALMVLAWFSSHEARPLAPALQSVWLPIHASLAMAANSFFALAAIGGIMYLLQERELKQKRLGVFFSRLPSLDALDTMNQHCLAVGFLLMTMGMVTGALWAKQAWGAYWHWQPKQTWTLVTWLVYAVLIHQRFTIGWRGRRSALLTVVAFGLVLFTFLGVNFLFSGLHNVG